MEEKKEKPRKKIVVEEVLESEVSKKEEKEVKPLPEEPKLTTEEPKSQSSLPVENEGLQSTPKFNFLWIIIPGILVLLALLGGIFVYEQGVSSQRAKLAEATPEATFSPEPETPTPTPTPAPIDLTKHPITVLNGSGIAGEGSRARTLLTKDGFKVAIVDNAKTFDFTKTKIQAKKSVGQDFISALKDTLSKSYLVDTNISVLPDSQAQDVIVTIGSSKPQ